MRDVKALNPARQPQQAQAILQLGQRHLGIAVGVALAGVVDPRVAIGQLHQLLPRPTLRIQQHHLGPRHLPRQHRRQRLVAQPLLLGGQVLNRQRQQHLVGNHRAAIVIKPDKRRDRLLVGKLLAGEAVRLAPEQPPLTHEQHRDLQHVALAMVAKHVLVQKLRRHRVLLLQRRLQRLELVANQPRLLKLQLVGVLEHAQPQPLGQKVVLAIQKQRHVAHLIGVVLFVDRQHAWRVAALDLILQARPLAPRQHLIGTGPQLEVAIDHPQRLPTRASRVIRPKVARPVVANPPRDL